MSATLNIGIWHENNRAAALAILDRNGRKERVATAGNEDPWWALVDVLEQCAELKAYHVSVVSNDKELVQVFTRPIRIAQPEMKRMWINVPRGNNNEWIRVKRGTGYTKQPLIRTKRGALGYWAKIPTGGHMGQWRTAWILFGYQSWQFMYSEKLQSTREVWDEY